MNRSLALSHLNSTTPGKDWQCSRESCYFAPTSTNLCGSRGSSQGDRILSRTLELKEKIGYVRVKAATFAMLGQLLADKKGDFDKALNYLHQSLDILQHLRSPEADKVRKIIARVQQMAGN
ncbi:hypothetical protein QUA54_09890 [Microcoleus sp. MOSTC5]|uniref:hypothetical protein n=1 Tax=Microcoleus sp. MOSTC5 TaxID=3055378 RepID=UPI003B070BAF